MAQIHSLSTSRWTREGRNSYLMSAYLCRAISKKKTSIATLPFLALIYFSPQKLNHPKKPCRLSNATLSSLSSLIHPSLLPTKTHQTSPTTTPDQPFPRATFPHSHTLESLSLQSLSHTHTLPSHPIPSHPSIQIDQPIDRSNPPPATQPPTRRSPFPPTKPF